MNATLDFKPKVPAEIALRAAAEICRALKPVTKQLCVAGSLRRRRPFVRDIEIVYVSQVERRPNPQDMFSTVEVSLVDEVIAAMEAAHILEKRENVNGSTTYGPKNKLMRHISSGIAVDFFATTTEAWANYLVCRTGPAESNIRIAAAAKRAGYKWNPYGSGFTSNLDGEVVVMKSEREVFEFVGLDYRKPEERQ
jgi:DNA polymerase/3'-5' exonuclease PolX